MIAAAVPADPLAGIVLGAWIVAALIVLVIVTIRTRTER